MPLPVFDGHNDLLLRLLRMDPEARDAAFLTGDGAGHLDMPRMRAGGFAAGLFAIYVPSPDPEGNHDRLMAKVPYDVPLPDPIPFEEAQATAFDMAGILLRLERISNGEFRLCRSVSEIETARRENAVAAILHMEGAEAIDADLEALQAFHTLGLRSLGPVWSRPTIFAHGVPFRFPSDPDTGPGLTDAGRDLVRECNRLRILIDLSHLNARGVEDVAALSDAPLVATHSAVHALAPSSRNLTERQLETIAASDGLVGLNYGVKFLREDGLKDTSTPLDILIRHLEHLIERLGEGGVALGSDFDGTTVPDGLADAAALPALVDAMRAAGWGENLIARVTWGNWVDVLRRTWGG